MSAQCESSCLILIVFSIQSYFWICKEVFIYSPLSALILAWSNGGKMVLMYLNEEPVMNVYEHPLSTVAKYLSLGSTVSSTMKQPHKSLKPTRSSQDFNPLCGIDVELIFTSTWRCTELLFYPHCFIEWKLGASINTMQESSITFIIPFTRDFCISNCRTKSLNGSLEANTDHKYFCKLEKKWQVQWAGQIVKISDEHLTNCIFYGELLPDAHFQGGQRNEPRIH